MRRVILGIGLAFAALVAVVAARALMVPAYQPPTAGSPPSKFDAGRVAAHLAEAVRFRTISWQAGAAEDDVAASGAAFGAFRGWIEATYPKFSSTASREIVADHTLLFTWTGSDPSLKPVLLMSHYPPFDGVVADGYVWGRGTLDVKCGVVGLLEAAEMLIGSGFKPKRTILFSFGHDEELGGHEGNEKVAALLTSRNTQLEFVIDEGGGIVRGLVPGVEAPVALLGVAEKGYVTLELTAKAAGGHSSLPPPVSETAIGRLARAIGRVGDAPFESRIDGITGEAVAELTPAMALPQRVVMANLWLFEPVVARILASSATGASIHTTIAPTVISGGIKDNVMPPDATVAVNFRIHPRDTIEGVVDHVTKAVDDADVEIKARPGAREASPVSDVRGRRYAFVKRTVEAVMPGVIVAPNLLSGGTDSRYFQPMTANVFRMVPAVIGPDDIKGAHGTNERVSVASMGMIADFFATIITTMDED